MDNSIQISQEHQSQGLMNLIQVKQEADDAPHIIYDDREQWAFLFSEAITGVKTEVDEPRKESYSGIAEIVSTGIKVEHDPESYDGHPEIHPTEIKQEIEPVVLDCHWCCFTATEPLDLIDHDYEKHSRFFQGKRIHKSYKCPSCAYTSIDPTAIRSHYYQLHRNVPDTAASQVNEIATPQKKKRKKKKQTWDTPLKKRRRPKKGQNADQDKIKEERRLRRMAYTRKYRASLSPDALAKRRLNDAARMRLKRALETEDAKAERRRKQALHARLKRANETPEEVERRRITQRNRARVRRSQETEEQRELRKERERLRARERRASLSVDKKEFIKEMERTRKRYRRHEAKVMNGDQFINAMEFLSTSLSNSENAYHLGHSSNGSSDPQSYNIESDDIKKMYPVPLHMFVGHITEDSSLPKSKAAKTVSKKTSEKNRGKNRKPGRPAVKRNKETKALQPSNSQNEDIPENSVRNFTILSESCNVPKSYTSPEDHVVRNDLIVHNDLKEPNINERLDWRIKQLGEVSQLNCIENTSKVIMKTNNDEINKICNERNINSENKTYRQPEATTNITRECNKDYIELEASIHQHDSELFNNIKQNQFSKIDKINKLLHRMYVRDSK
ncbi:hypothetical protein O3M35_000294 [Rhynocoris fuscipes]|uniref:C2H2-type domain-containing protein n=1 Tax=Rhynocoris fuscipes TaxID=488301 RepID=A0AAW1DLW2_9HEMI